MALTLTGSAWIVQAANPNLCEVIRAARSGQFTPQQLCDAYNEPFCRDYSMSAAICEVGGGSFCHNVKDDFEAICEAKGDAFCSNMDSETRLKYFRIIDGCMRN